MMDDTTPIKAGPGQSIYDFCEELVSWAKSKDAPVFGEFNEIVFRAQPKSLPEDLGTIYYLKLRVRVCEHLLDERAQARNERDCA